MINTVQFLVLLGILSQAICNEIRYPVKKQHHLSKRDHSNSSVDLNVYTIEFKVGSKEKKISALMDINSSDFWFLGDNACNTYINSSIATKHLNKTTNETILNICKHGTFNSLNSTTFKKIYKNNVFYKNYESDNSFAAGYWGADNIMIGNATLENVTFGVASIANSTSKCGLGFRNAESSNINPAKIGNISLNISGIEIDKNSTKSFSYDNLPYSLKSQGFIQRVAYSLFLNTETKNGSSILFGAVDEGQFNGKLSTVPIVRNSSLTLVNKTKVDDFVITLQGVGFVDAKGHGTTFNTQMMPALVDTGVTGVILPKTIADSIAKQMKAKFNNKTRKYELKCPNEKNQKLSAFVFNIGGINFFTKYSDFITSGNNSKNCVLDINYNHLDSTVLGDAFLKSLYVLFDLESYEMSFGQAKLDSAPSSIVVIPSNGSTFEQATKAEKYSTIWTASPTSYTTGGDIFDSSKTISNPFFSGTTSKTFSTKTKKAENRDHEAKKSKNMGSVLSIGYITFLISIFI